MAFSRCSKDERTRDRLENGGKTMSHHKEHSFDAYCKTILRRTAANAHKQRKRLAVREIPFSGLSETELNRLCCYDDYESDKQIFTACGREIEIRCDALCLALEALTQRQRDILLLLAEHRLTADELVGRTEIPARRVNTAV